MITLDQADRLIDAILARGAELDCRPLAVIVVEPGCKVKAFKKEDAGAVRPLISHEFFAGLSSGSGLLDTSRSDFVHRRHGKALLFSGCGVALDLG